MILSLFIFKFISVKKICYIKKLSLYEVKHSYVYDIRVRIIMRNFL